VKALEATDLVWSIFRVVARDDILTSTQRTQLVGIMDKSKNRCAKRMYKVEGKVEVVVVGVAWCSSEYHRGLPSYLSVELRNGAQARSWR
jgi:hypothetical protein